MRNQFSLAFIALVSEIIIASVVNFVFDIFFLVNTGGFAPGVLQGNFMGACRGVGHDGRYDDAWREHRKEATMPSHGGYCIEGDQTSYTNLQFDSPWFCNPFSIPVPWLFFINLLLYLYWAGSKKKSDFEDMETAKEDPQHEQEEMMI